MTTIEQLQNKVDKKYAECKVIENAMFAYEKYKELTPADEKTYLDLCAKYDFLYGEFETLSKELEELPHQIDDMDFTGVDNEDR